MGVRGYPDYLVNKVLAEVQLTSRRSTFEQKPLRVQSGLMHFATQYSASVPNVKSILMCKWHLIQNRPLLKETYREPSFISYSKGKSLKDILVKPGNSLLPLCNEKQGCTAVRANIRHEFYEVDAALAKTVNHIINWKGPQLQTTDIINVDAL